MGAKNTESTGKKFFKLVENENKDSKMFGRFEFVEQVKENGKWVPGPQYNTLEGGITDVSTQEYEWEGKKVTNLRIAMDDGFEKMEFSLGFNSIAAQNILNTLAGEEKYGTFSFQCGAPKTFNGKSFPTVYIKNNGQKTNWKFKSAEIPKITKEVDEDGNTIRKGQKALTEFWLNILDKHIKPKVAKEVVGDVAKSVTDDLPW